MLRSSITKLRAQNVDFIKSILSSYYFAQIVIYRNVTEFLNEKKSRKSRILFYFEVYFLFCILCAMKNSHGAWWPRAHAPGPYGTAVWSWARPVCVHSGQIFFKNVTQKNKTDGKYFGFQAFSGKHKIKYNLILSKHLEDM